MTCNRCNQPIIKGQKYFIGPRTRQPHHAECPGGDMARRSFEDEHYGATADEVVDSLNEEREKP